MLTVRGDDPGSAADPWLETAAGAVRAGAAARTCARRRRRSSPAGGRASTGGRPPGRPCGWRPGAAAGAAWRRRAPAIPLSRAWAARGLGALRDGADVLELLAAAAARPGRGRAGERAARAGRSSATRAGAARSPPSLLVARAAPCAWRRCARWPRSRPTARCASAIVAVVGDARSRGPRRRAGRAGQAWTARSFALVLSGLDPDPDLVGARGAGRGAGRGGRRGSVAILFAMLKDEDAARAARGAGGAAQGARARPRRRRCAGTSSTRTSRCARPPSKGLAELKAAAACPRRWRPPTRARSRDADPDARLQRWWARWRKKDDAARAGPAARGGASDPSRVVRARAAAALRAQGAEAPEPGPDGRRPPAPRLPRGDGALRSAPRRRAVTRRARSCTRATARSRST